MDHGVVFGIDRPGEFAPDQNMRQIRQQRQIGATVQQIQREEQVGGHPVAMGLDQDRDAGAVGQFQPAIQQRQAILDPARADIGLKVDMADRAVAAQFRIGQNAIADRQSRRLRQRAKTVIRVHEAAKTLGFPIETPPDPRAHDAPQLVFGLLLPPNDREFYEHLIAEAQRAVQDFTRARVRLIVDYIPDMTPDEVCQRLDALGAQAQVIGLSCIDHPRITEHVQRIQDRGIPVIALLSDFAQGVRAAYVGTNNLKVGRTAATMLAHGIPRHVARAEVALLVGGHRWHGHDLRETGFRAWFRENRPEISVLDINVNLNAADLSYEATKSMLASHPDLRGIYCAGGGREGLIRATREAAQDRRPDVIMNELTEITRDALTRGCCRWSSTPRSTRCS